MNFWHISQGLAILKVALNNISIHNIDLIQISIQFYGLRSLSYHLIIFHLSLARSFENMACYNMKDAIRVEFVGPLTPVGMFMPLLRVSTSMSHFLVLFLRFDTGRSFFLLFMLDVHSIGKPSPCGTL